MNTYRIKRKSVGIISAVITFVMMAFFCFVGCAQTYNGAGKFVQTSITLSVGEVFDPSKLIETNILLSYESEDERVLSKTESGKFLAQKTGETSLVAMHGENVVDILSVFVRDQFSIPTNIKMSNNGLITWDNSFVIQNGGYVYATYKISLEKDGRSEEILIQNNSYQLTESGKYKIKIKAEQLGEILESQYSQEYVFNYALNDQPKQVVFNPEQTFGSQKGTLNWNGTGENYDLIFDGIEKQAVSGNSYVLDFTNFGEDSSTYAEVIANNGDLESKSSVVEIQKITTPNVDLENDELVWGDVQNATDFVISYSSTNEQGSFVADDNSSLLEGLAEGVYQISYQALAQQNFANGDVKSFGKVAKVGNVETEYEFLGNTLQVTFSTRSQYNRKIVVTQNGKSQEFILEDYSNGEYFLVQSFDLIDGENVFLLQTFPTYDDGRVVIDGISVSSAVKSDETRLFSAYNIGEIKNLQHNIENDESVLTFDNVEYANSFEVYVNEIKVQSLEVSIGESTTKILLGKLSSDIYDIYGDSETYIIKLFATRGAQENQIATTSQAEKILTRLKAPKLANRSGSNNGSQTYSWEEVSGAKYEYALYTTAADYDLTQAEPIINQTNNNFIDNLNAGYYVLQVKSVPVDNDLYLESEDYEQDRFYVALPIEQPRVKLDYSADENCYVLTIISSEFAYEYKISLNSVLLGSVFNNNQSSELVYKFDSSYKFDLTSEEYVLSVEAVAKTEEEQIIHTNSSSSLIIKRLQAPTEKTVEQNGEALTVKNTDENAIIILIKDGKEIARSESGKDAKISLDDYSGSFSISAKLEGYQSFNDYTTNGTINLESNNTTFSFYRSSTPSNVYFNEQNVYFSHQTQNNLEKNYIVEVTATSVNGSSSTTFEIDLTSFKPTELSFNIVDSLQTVLEENTEFASHYNQMTSLKVKLYSNICQDIEGITYLPSNYATLKYNNKLNELEIQRLEKVKLDYDDVNRTITWNAVQGDNVEYYVYYNFSNNENKVEKIIQSVEGQSIYSFDLTGYDFTKPYHYEFYVVAVSDNAFDSLPSGKIIVQKISPIESLNVFVRDGKYMASFELKNIDLDRVSHININGFDYQIVATEFELSTDGEYPTVNQNNEVTIKIFGKAFEENGDATYYISSELSTFVLRELVVGEYDAQINISQGVVNWQDFALSNVNDWSLTTPLSNNVRYELRLLGESGQLLASITNITTNSLSLDNETLLNILDGTQGKIQIYAYISDYSVSQGGRGYFGKTLIGEGATLNKLNSVTNLKAEIDESETTIDGELEKTVNLTWDDELNQNATYEIFVNGDFVGYTTEKAFNLTQSNLETGENIISVVATSGTEISSNKTEISVWRFAKPNLDVTDDGVLTISETTSRPSAGNGYIIEMTIGDNEPITFYSYNNNEIDLQPYINGASGDYKILVIARATNYVDVAVPCNELAEFTGDIIPQPTFTQNERGLKLASPTPGAVFYVVCEERNFIERVGNYQFDFPDDWDSGDYNLLIYVVRNGYITSWRGDSAKQTITINRIENTPSVSFQRTEDYNDYVISWTTNEKASGYSIEVIQNNETILTSGVLKGESVNLSQLFNGNTLPSGDMTFAFRTIASYETSTLTNSLPLKFAVNKIRNTVNSIAVVDDLSNPGYLKYYAGYTGVASQVEVEDVAGNIKRYIVKEVDEKKYSYLRIDGLSGSLNVRIRLLALEKQGDDIQVSSEGTIKLDSDQKVKQMYKTQNIYSVHKDMKNGIVEINFPRDETYSKTNIPNFYVEYNGQKQKLTPIEIIYNATSYSFYAPDITELFGIEDGNFEFNLSMAFDGCLVSDDFQASFEFKNADSSIVAVKGEDERDDFILVKFQDKDIKSIIVRSAEKEYYKIDLTNIKGYWVTQAGEEAGYFSQTEVVGANNEACYAINVGSLLENFDAGQKNLQVAYVYDNQTTGFSLMGYCGAISYTKLVAPDSINIDLGNLSWSISEGAGTAFLISFEGENSTNEIKVYDVLTNYYLGGDIPYQGTYNIAIQNVSSQMQVLASNKTYVGGESPAQISKIKDVSNVTLANGVMSINFTGAGELANDINNISSASQESLKTSVDALLNKVYTEPFRFSLKNLAELQFNLKFVNEQGQAYITTVSASNILKGFDTPLDGFVEGDRMFNKSIIEGIASILADLPNGTTEKAQLNEIYLLLTDENKWTGVANEDLLFDEMGENLASERYEKVSAEYIQAGEYDIYIQQEGSEEFLTLSSNYSLAISNAKVESSPMTLTGVTSDDVYYIEFQTKEGNDNYTLTIRHDENGKRVTEIVKIAKIEGSWMRTAVGENEYSKELEARNVGERSFVKLTLNDEQGIGKELNAGEGASSTHYTFNIYANGNSVALNSKTEEIDVYFFAFNYDTLRLSSGVFYWSGFKIAIGSDVVSYDALVKYKLENFSEQNQIIKASTSQTSQSYNPSSVGNYEYIEFSTPGWREDYAIYVGSPSYRIENLTKLSSPELTTQNGKILMTDINSTTRENRTFTLRNNATSYYSLSFTTNEKSYLHTPGLNGMINSSTTSNEYNYRITEDRATLFDVSLAGDTINQGEFVLNSSSQFNSFVLNVEAIQDRIYLQSSAQSISAKMIDYKSSTSFNGVPLTDGVQIVDGAVVWKEVNNEVLAGFKIIYEVQVETYYKTSASWTKDEYCTKTYYTSQNYLDSSLFVDSVASEQRYVIYIRANVYAESNTGEIETLQGEKFDLSTQATFEGNASRQVLNGELISNYTLSADKFFVKSKKVDTLSIQNGELSWSYNNEGDLKTKFIVEYSVAGLNDWKELLHEEGEIDCTNNIYSFTPQPGQLLSDSAYNFRISVINYKENSSGEMIAGGELKSNLTLLGGQSYSQIYVLKDMTNDYFTTSRENNNYKINFANYYNNYPSISRNINLEIVFKNSESETKIILDGKTSSKEIDITEYIDEEGYLEFTVKPLSLSSSYLNAQSTQSFTLSETSWFEADKINFNEQTQTFDWTYGAIYQYKAVAEDNNNIVVYYNNGTQFLPYGVSAGETVQVFADESMQGKLPIYYNEMIYYVDLSKASYSYKEGEDQAYVTILEDTSLLSWVDNQFVETEISLAKDETFEFAQKYFVVKKQLLDDTEEKVYFVPLSAVASDGQRFAIKSNGVVYLDEEFSAFKGIESGSFLNISSKDTPDNGYYTLNDYSGSSVYVHVSNVEILTVKDENVDPENILFRVEIKSQHDVVSQGVTTSTTTTRIYENISIEGENEAGIFTATFEPNLIGTILSFTVQVYRGKNNLLSEPLQYSASSLSFNLFSSGDGSGENPYIIEEEQDFENISYRAEKKYYHNEYYQSQTVIVHYSNGTSSSPKTSEGQVQDNDKYYSFKQNQDLAFEDVNGFVVDQAFKGNYDGNNKTISISFASTDVIDSYSSDIQGATVNFERGASLFREITTDGNISNIQLNARFDYTAGLKNSCTQDGELKSTLIAGLSVKNNGSVSGVTVVAVQVNFETNISGNGSRLAFAGIVGKNEGSMSDCVSQANVQIRQSANPNGTQNFVLSPITLFNDGTSANMNNCRNIGNILVNWRIASSNDNSSILVSGVVVSNRYGSIELCYNTGAISAKTFVGSSSSNATVGKQTYATGVVLYQQGGSLLYASNSGTISAGNAGGVAYSLTNVRIANMVALGKVDTGSSSMFNYLIAKEIIGLSGQTIYTHVVSPSGLENVELISADRVITCGNTNWSIYVDYTSKDVHEVQYVKN